MQTYWNNNGKHQPLLVKLTKQLEREKMAHNKPVVDSGMCPWNPAYAIHERAFWENEACHMLLNTISSIYYACYNYNETPSEAIHNERILGFNNFGDVRDLLPYDTPDLIIEFLQSERKAEKSELEKVFDTAVEYLVE